LWNDSAGLLPAVGGEKLWKNCRKILRALLQKLFLQFFHNYSLPPLLVEGPQNLSTIFLQFFYNFSTILPCVEEFGAIGLAWRRIVEGIIVEKLWNPLVNAAPGQRKVPSEKCCGCFFCNPAS
jgi:hypothetical protein